MKHRKRMRHARRIRRTLDAAQQMTRAANAAAAEQPAAPKRGRKRAAKPDADSA